MRGYTRKKKSKEKEVEKEEVPSPFGSKAPELSTREPINLKEEIPVPKRVKEQDEERIDEDKVAQINKHILGVPGLSALKKKEIMNLIIQRCYKVSKEDLIKSVCSIYGLGNPKKKVITKILEKEL